MNGMNVQASIAMIMRRAISGVPKKDGFSQPSQRASVASGPKRVSIIDLPIIQLTATGLSINGSRKTTRKNLRATICELSSSASPKAMAYSMMHRGDVEHHVAQRVPVKRVAHHLVDIVEAVELPTGKRTQVPVGKRNQQPEDQREDDHRNDKEHRGKHEKRALALLAAHHHLRRAQRRAPGDIGVEDRPPAFEAEVDVAVVVQRLQKDHRNKHRAGAEDQQLSKALARRR